MVLRLVLLVGLLACSNEKKDAPPPPPTAATVATMTEDEIVDASLKSMAQIATLANKYAADCEALAKALSEHATQNKPVIDAFKKLSADETKQRDIAQRHGGRILAIAQDTVKALQANCAEHPAVKALFKTLNN